MKHFVRIAMVTLIGLTVAGCDWQTFKTDTSTGWAILTGAQSSVPVTEKTVYIARNAFDAVEQTATNYLNLCHASPSNPVCSARAEGQLVQAVRAGRKARRDLAAYIAANPAGGTGGQTLQSQLIAATQAVKDVLAAYKIGG